MIPTPPAALRLALSRWPVTPATRATVRAELPVWARQSPRAGLARIGADGVLPLATAVLREAAWDLLSPEWRSFLDDCSRQSAAYSMRVMQHTGDVLARLEAAGVAPVWFKGPVLAQALFDHHHRRPGGDIDLLVDGDAVDRVVDELVAAGYVVRVPTNVPALRPAQHAVTLDPAEPFHMPEIDVHWAFTEAWVSTLPGDWRRHTAWVEVAGLRVRTLGPSLAALQAVLHLAGHGYLFRHAVDLAGWDRRLTDAEREDLRSLAVEAGCEGHVLCGLELVRELWGPPALHAGPALPGASGTAHARAAYLRGVGVGPAAVLRGGVWQRPYVRVLLRALGADHRWRALAGLVGQSLWPPRAYLEWRYGDASWRTRWRRPWRALRRLGGDLIGD